MTEENQTPESVENAQVDTTAQAEPQAENVQEQPVVGAEVPANPQVPEPQPETTEPQTEAEPQPEAPTVTEPVNQPETEEVEPAAEENATEAQPKNQELVSRYTFGVYLKNADRVEQFEMEFLSRSSKVAEMATALLKENVENAEDYTVRLKRIELFSVHNG